MSKYLCWLNAGKNPGDTSLRAVSISDPERLVWLNLPKADALKLGLFTDQMRANFGKVSTTIDLESVVDRIERTKDGDRRLQLESFAELLRLAKAQEVVKAEEPTAEDISAIADFFGAPAPATTASATDGPF
jgi:hypothetical protein